MKSYNVEATAKAFGMPIPLWRPSKGYSSSSVIEVESPKSDLGCGRHDDAKTVAVAVNVTRSLRTSGSTMQSPYSLHRAIRPIILLAQCFAVFPLSGVNSPDASYLRFKWKSLKILYWAVSFAGAFVMAVCSIMRLTVTRITSTKTINVVFFGVACVTSMLFVRLAKQWPSLCLAWEKAEREMSSRYTKVSKIRLTLKFRIMAVVVMVLALVEHSLSVVSGYISALECASLRGDSNILATYFQTQFPQIFGITCYAHWKAILVECVNILSTFSWNYMDLFLILLSSALAEQFRHLNRRLNSIREKAMPEWWWAEARIDYNRLATLTRLVDHHVSDIVFVSFGNNLYFICIQLLNSFNSMRNIAQTVYFCFSFGFLIARTAAVSLYAASVRDESLIPAPVLYSVSGSCYSTEVVRFLTQVTTDNVGLTGMKFFSVTRSLVLTIAGTIVTYELVLVQFNAIQQDDDDTINITNACAVK